MKPDGQPPARILIRGVNWLGDAVMTTPALLRLREALPRAHISLLTPEKLADLWHQHPAVDEVFVMARNESLLRVARQLRCERFDVAIAFPNSHRSALELWLARIPRRIGYAAPVRRWFLTDPLPRSGSEVRMRKRTHREIQRLIAGPDPHPEPDASARLEAHHLHQYLPLVQALGARPIPLAPLLVVSDAELAVAREKFLAHVTERLPVVGLNPGAEYGPAKRWPLERFAQAARDVHAQQPCHWVLLGGKADVPLTATLFAQLQAAGLPVTDVAGRTSLRELCALLKACQAVLTNDTGPMHVAAALGTPVIAVFGSTSPELTAPGLPGDPRHQLLRAHVPCSPCFLRECPIDSRCLDQVTAGAAASALLAALGGA